jgi:hypothetical protein
MRRGAPICLALAGVFTVSCCIARVIAVNLMRRKEGVPGMW